jgi:hypothetical protein
MGNDEANQDDERSDKGYDLPWRWRKFRLTTFWQRRWHVILA